MSVFYPLCVEVFPFIKQKTLSLSDRSCRHQCSSKSLNPSLTYCQKQTKKRRRKNQGKKKKIILLRAVVIIFHPVELMKKKNMDKFSLKYKKLSEKKKKKGKCLPNLTHTPGLSVPQVLNIIPVGGITHHLP